MAAVKGDALTLRRALRKLESWVLPLLRDVLADLEGERPLATYHRQGRG